MQVSENRSNVAGGAERLFRRSICLNDPQFTVGDDRKIIVALDQRGSCNGLLNLRLDILTKRHRTDQRIADAVQNRLEREFGIEALSIRDLHGKDRTRIALSAQLHADTLTAFVQLEKPIVVEFRL